MSRRCLLRNVPSMLISDQRSLTWESSPNTCMKKYNWMWKMGGAALLGLLWPMFILYNFIPLISSLQIALWKTVNRNYANYWQLLISCMFLIVHCYSPLLLTLFPTDYNILMGGGIPKTTFFWGVECMLLFPIFFKELPSKVVGSFRRQMCS